MITRKETLLAMRPDDTLIIPTTNFTNTREIDFSGDVRFLTFEIPGEKNRCALLLSGDEEVSMFKASNPYHEKLYYKHVKMKNLLPVLMVHRLSLLVDPFEDPLVTMTPTEMCAYCTEHQNEIFTGDLHNIWYLNLRISQAKKNGDAVKAELLKELAEMDSFWVISPTFRPVSPFVSTVSKVDCRPHIMVFTSLKLAQQFVDHLRGGRKDFKGIPMQMSVKNIQTMITENPQAGIEQFYLNDGSEAMAFSYSELLTACRR